ncbi:uncharacterized protein E0L32_010527 [Thyridium curvatum]|uniref:Uncharacterized protein n=1 Tax=Thyridium curvatum TaxID=1093900 RepID=A0A507AUF2_9PEZI|nr:uncharacterized protein E0L32_010527 [Thyridium curvatum]TPX07840.1 hypothetical protein E0L32_010527 [Thyridium curvatum]
MSRQENLTEASSSTLSAASPLSKPPHTDYFCGRFVDRGDGWPEDITWWKDFLMLDLGKECFKDIQSVYQQVQEKHSDKKLPDWPFYLFGPRDLMLHLEEYLKTGSTNKYKASHVLPDHIRSGKADERVFYGWPAELVQQGYNLFRRAASSPELTVEELLGDRCNEIKPVLESEDFARSLIFLDIFKKAEIVPSPGTSGFISSLRTKVFNLHFYRKRAFEVPPGFFLIQKNHELASPRHVMFALNSSNFNALREMNEQQTGVSQDDPNGSFYDDIWMTKMNYLQEIDQIVVRNAMRDAQIWLLAEECEERQADMHWGQQSFGKNGKLYTYQSHLGTFKFSPSGDGFPQAAYVVGENNRGRSGLDKDTLEGAMRAREEFKARNENEESKSEGSTNEDMADVRAEQDGEDPAEEAGPAEAGEDSNGPAKPEALKKNKHKKKNPKRKKAKKASTSSAAADEVKADDSGTSTVVDNDAEGSTEAGSIETAVKDRQGPELEEDDQSQDEDKTPVDGQTSEAIKSDDASPPPSSPRTITDGETTVQGSLSWDEEVAELEEKNAKPNDASQSFPNSKAPTETSAAEEPKVEKEITSTGPMPPNVAEPAVDSKSAPAQAVVEPQKSGSEEEPTPSSQPKATDVTTNAGPAMQLSLDEMGAMPPESVHNWQKVKARGKAKTTTKANAGAADSKKKGVGSQSLAPAAEVPSSKDLSSAQESTSPPTIRIGSGKFRARGAASSQIKGNASMPQAGQTSPMNTPAKKAITTAPPAPVNKATATTPANSTGPPVAARPNETAASGAPQLAPSSTQNGTEDRPAVTLPQREKPRNPAEMAKMGMKAFIAADLENKRAAKEKAALEKEKAEKAAMLAKEKAEQAAMLAKEKAEKAAMLAEEKAAKLEKKKIAHQEGVNAQAEPGANKQSRKAASKTSRKPAIVSTSASEDDTSVSTAAPKPSEKQAKTASNAGTDTSPGTTSDAETPSATEALKASLAAAEPPKPAPVVQQSFEIDSHRWPSLGDSKEPEMPENSTETCDDPNHSIPLTQSTNEKPPGFKSVQPERPVESKQPDQPTQQPAKKKKHWETFNWSAETQSSNKKEGTSKPHPRPPAPRHASTKRALRKKAAAAALKRTTAPKPAVDKEESTSSALASSSAKDSENTRKASPSTVFSTDKSGSTQPFSFAVAATKPAPRCNDQTHHAADPVEKGPAGKEPPTGQKAAETPTQASKRSETASSEKADAPKTVMSLPGAAANASQSTAQKQKQVASTTTAAEKQHVPGSATQVQEKPAENSATPGILGTHVAQATSSAVTADRKPVDKGKGRVGPGLYTVLEQDEVASNAAPVEKIQQQVPGSVTEVQGKSVEDSATPSILGTHVAQVTHSAVTADKKPVDKGKGRVGPGLYIILEQDEVASDAAPVEHIQQQVPRSVAEVQLKLAPLVVNGTSVVQGSFSATPADEKAIDKVKEHETTGTPIVSDPPIQTTPQNVQLPPSELPPVRVREVSPSDPNSVAIPATTASHTESITDAGVTDYDHSEESPQQQLSIAREQQEQSPPPSWKAFKVPRHDRPGALSDPLPFRSEDFSVPSSLLMTSPTLTPPQEDFHTQQTPSEQAPSQKTPSETPSKQAASEQFPSQNTPSEPTPSQKTPSERASSPCFSQQSSSQESQVESVQQPMHSQRAPRGEPPRNFAKPGPRMRQQPPPFSGFHRRYRPQSMSRSPAPTMPRARQQQATPTTYQQQPAAVAAAG